MPELPEVETIKRQLTKVLPGKIFSGVEIRLAKQVKGIAVAKFKKEITGAKVIGLERRAKMLIICIQKSPRFAPPLLKTPDGHRQTPGGKQNHKKQAEKFLVFHLKMTGQLIYSDGRGHLKGGGHPIKNALRFLPNKYSHVIFNFKDKTHLYFNDLRQFGWVTLVDSHKAIELLSATPLGVEPLSKNFKLDGFINCLKKRPRAKIYQALMDQRCVVGVGNIYANESLFYAGIRPTRQNKDIKKAEFEKLYQGIIKILKKSVNAKGTTISDFMDALGNYGQFSKQLKVYGREGKQCQRSACRGLVERIKINGRSAFYCVKCQK